MKPYSAGQYYDQDTKRYRWAVLGPNNAWYFASQRGYDAAVRLANRLNKKAS